MDGILCLDATDCSALRTAGCPGEMKDRIYKSREDREDTEEEKAYRKGLRRKKFQMRSYIQAGHYHES